MSEGIIINLWERLSHIYGHKFTSTYGLCAFNGKGLTSTAKTWCSGLKDITGEQIAKGLHECIKCGESWPPTLPEFVKMCKGSTKNEFGLNYIPQYHRTAPQKQRIESDELVASRKAQYKKGLAELRNILKKQK